MNHQYGGPPWRSRVWPQVSPFGPTTVSVASSGTSETATARSGPPGAGRSGLVKTATPSSAATAVCPSAQPVSTMRRPSTRAHSCRIRKD